MRFAFVKVLVACMFFLASSGCGTGPVATPFPSVSPDTFETTTSNQVRASGVAVPITEAHLSFPITGVVKTIYVMEGEAVQAGQDLVRLDTAELEFHAMAAQATLDAAIYDLEVERLREKAFNFGTFQFEYVSPPAEEIESAEARVEQSRFAMQAAEAALAQGTLRAPFDGTVVEINIAPGEFVQPAQVIIVLADLDYLRIETTDLSELDVAAVEIGQPVGVFVDALETEYPGKVASISPIADTLGGDVVFTITVELDSMPSDLLWGMSADVEIGVE